MNNMVGGIFTTFGPLIIQWIQFMGEEDRCDPLAEIFPSGKARFFLLSDKMTMKNRFCTS